MATKGPVLPQDASAAGALARMTQFRNAEKETQAESKPASSLRYLLVIASVLSFVGGCFSLCAMALICAPDSGFAQMLSSACALIS